MHRTTLFILCVLYASGSVQAKTTEPPKSSDLTEYKIPLNLRFVDALTSQSVTNVTSFALYSDSQTGIFLNLDPSTNMTFEQNIEMISEEGITRLPKPTASGEIHTELTLPNRWHLIRHMEYQKCKEDPEASWLKLHNTRREASVYIGIKASGYALCTYTIYPEVWSEGKLVIIPLQPAIQIKARVPAGAPQGDYFNALFVCPSGNRAGLFSYPFMVGSKIGNDGRFSITDIQPSAGWIMQIRERTVQRDMEFHAGLNDLGEIDYPGNGTLTVQVLDEKAKPVPGAWVQIPHAPIKNQTAESGVVHVGIAQELRGSRQLLQVIPPGTAPENPMGGLSSWYERIVNLDFGQDNRFAATIKRTYTLTVRIQITESLLKAVEYYRLKALREFPSEVLCSHIKDKEEPKERRFGLTKIRLYQTNPGPDGFSFCRDFIVPIDKAPLRVGLKEQVMHIKGVPSGQYALQLAGSLYVVSVPSKMTVQSSPPVVLGYQDFVMPDADHELNFSPQGQDVEIKLDSILPDASVLAGVTAFLERTEPLSTSFNDPWYYMQRVSNILWYRPSAQPFISFNGLLAEGRFPENGSQNDAVYNYRPLYFPNVPPGTYHLRFVSNLENKWGSMVNTDLKPDIQILNKPNARKEIRIPATVFSKKRE